MIRKGENCFCRPQTYITFIQSIYDREGKLIFKSTNKNCFDCLIKKLDKNIEAVSEALGKKPLELFRNRDAVAVFKNEEDIKSMTPSMDKLKKLDYPAVIVTAPGEKVDFVSRNFAPKLGIPEDPVTGSAHCELIPYWSKILNKKELLANQISERGGKPATMDAAAAAAHFEERERDRERGAQSVSFEW